MNRYPWYLQLAKLSLLILLANCASQTGQKPSDERPNIVIILADDMGYSDIGPYGGEIHTPNLDKLARNGVRFRSFYNAAKCCPTRASLMTGLYQHEAGMGAMITAVNTKENPGTYQGFLNQESLTIAEALKLGGYATYMSGKWHLGERKKHWPRTRGFDRYFGLISGASSYYEIIKDQPRFRQMAYDDENWYPPENGFYMTDAFADTAVSFLEGHLQQAPEQPFFLALTFNAPHWPLHALPEDIAKYKDRYLIGWDSLRKERYARQFELGIMNENYPLSERNQNIPAWAEVKDKESWAHRMAVYAAMIDRMDQGIGRVIDKIESEGKLDNTLIIFLSDNGGCAEDISGRKLHDFSKKVGAKGSYVAYKEPWANASNTPFRYYKNWVHEGGSITPFIAHYPKKIHSAGSINTEHLGHIVDVMPTCLDAAGIKYPEIYQEKRLKPLRGKSLLPALTQQKNLTDRTLFWEFNDARAVRQGDWKLVWHKPRKKWELYDLSKDPTELHDLSLTQSKKVDELQKLYNTWASEVGVIPLAERKRLANQ